MLSVGVWELFLGLSLPLLACTHASAYPIKDSGVPLPNPNLLMNVIAWLDNTHVAFNGESIGLQKSAKPGGDATVREQGLYVWDIDANKVTRQTKLEHQTSLCVFEGVLSYQEKGLIITWKLGESDQQRPLPHPFWVNPFSCRYYESSPPWMVKGRETAPLREEHGYLDWGTSDLQNPNYFKNTPLTLYSPGNAKGVTLPVGRRQVQLPNSISYAPFRKAYLLSSDHYRDPATGVVEEVGGSWPKGKPVPIWWLTPDGTVTEMEFPYHPFMLHGSRGFLAAKSDIFAWSHALAGGGGPGEAGGYLTHSGTVQKLIAGLLHNPVISPDGCRVAFVHDPYDTQFQKDRRDRITVKVIELCDGGSNE